MRHEAQSTTNLGSSAIWTTNSLPPVVVNGQYTVTNPVSGSDHLLVTNVEAGTISVFDDGGSVCTTHNTQPPRCFSNNTTLFVTRAIKWPGVGSIVHLCLLNGQTPRRASGSS